MSHPNKIRLLLSTSGDVIVGHFPKKRAAFKVDKVEGGPLVLFRDRGHTSLTNVRVALKSGKPPTEKNLVEGSSIEVLHRGQVFWKDTIKRIV